MIVYSCFLMSVRDIYCLVTAGNVLNDIDEKRANAVELGTFRLWDGWTPGTPHRGYVTFDYDAPPKLRVDENGLDYGLIPLSQYYVSNLLAVKTVPITEEQYEREWPADFDAFAMIGTPWKTTSLERHGKRGTKVTQSVSITRLEPELNPPKVLVHTAPQFYARLLVPEESTEWNDMGGDIRGMSGGPVIGLRRDEEGLKYYILGVQSAWEESRRVIAACPFQVFAKSVGTMLDTLDKEGA